MKKLLILIAAVLTFCTDFTAHAQVTVIQNADLQKFLARYELVKEATLDMSDKSGAYVFVAMKNLDDPKAPILGFIEENREVTAAKLKASAWITVEAHPTDRRKIVVNYFDKYGQKFFFSSLSPFGK